jgi:methionyl-tRNA formyltransferase
VFGELAIDNYQFAIERAMRALSPWPGLWTIVTVNGEEKRLKILDLSIIHSQIAINSVQLEGKKPVSWKQFASVYLAHTT